METTISATPKYETQIMFVNVFLRRWIPTFESLDSLNYEEKTEKLKKLFNSMQAFYLTIRPAVRERKRILDKIFGVKQKGKYDFVVEKKTFNNSEEVVRAYAILIDAIADDLGMVINKHFTFVEMLPKVAEVGEDTLFSVEEQ